MPPSIVPLPARAGSLKFSDEDVTAVIDLLGQIATGQAVKLHDDPDEKENTSRRRAEVMKEQIEARTGAVPAGMKLRGHVLTAGEPTVKKISGKNYKFFPENWAAVSLVPDTEPDSEPDTPPDESPAADGVATDAPDATDGNTPDADGGTPEEGETGRRGGRRS